MSDPNYRSFEQLLADVLAPWGDPIQYIWLKDTLPKPVGYWHLVQGPWWRRGCVAEARERISHAWETLRHGCDRYDDW